MPFLNPSDVPTDRPMDTIRRSGASVVFKQSTPPFILEEYPLFVEFLEAYYEWLDQEGNPVEFLSNGSKYFDIDTTSDLFLEHFKKTFLDGFPKRLTSADTGVQQFDDRILIKNIREFYKTKGSEKSIQLLFKILANTDATIEYPRDKMFVVSSANYRDFQLLYVLKDYNNISNGFDAANIEGLDISQFQGIVDLIGNAKIETLHEIANNGKEYYIITISNLVGNFFQSDYQPLIIKQNGVDFEFFPVPSVAGMEIINGGTDYVVGDVFTVGNTAQEAIHGYISLTDYSGKITKVKIFSNPVNFTGSGVLSIQTALGTGAAFSITEAIVSDNISEYSNNKNLVGGSSKIQDSFEYQQFSYLVKSKRPLEAYLDAIKKIVHPSGFVILNSLYNNIYSNRPTEYKTRILAYEYPTLGAYAGYTPNTVNGSGNTNGYYPNTFDGDPTKKYGRVFSYWADEVNPSDPFINPSIGNRSIPSGSDAGISGGISGDFLSLGSGRLLDPRQSQFDGITHWIVLPHPSVRGTITVPLLTSFTNMKIIEMLRMPVPILTKSIDNPSIFDPIYFFGG